MEVKITRNGKEEIIKIGNLKGKHQKEYMRMLSKLMKTKEDPSILVDFLDFRDRMITDLTSLTQEELDEMELGTKSIISDAIEKKITVMQTMSETEKN